jgi:GDPmannose 4,6-dehydratase
MTKRALIFGITGQDGSYLAKLLINKKYNVFGVTRNINFEHENSVNLEKLSISDNVNLLHGDSERSEEVNKILQFVMPDEIYILSGQTSVGLSFEFPDKTIHSNVIGALNILEACRQTNPNVKIFNACSSECYGDTRGVPVNEQTPFNPESPYALSKVITYWLTKKYRDEFDLFCCSGLLFNHESPLRSSLFVSQKVISAVKRIAEGSDEILALGRLDIVRDWGWAPEYVDAMWRMLQMHEPQDFVIATGTAYSLKDFVKIAFAHYELDWRKFVKQDNKFIRSNDILISRADPFQAKEILGWEAKTYLPEVIKKMICEVY